MRGRSASTVLRALGMRGVAAAVVRYLSLVIPRLNARTRYQYILFVVFGLLAAVPVLMGNGSKIRVVAALASANVFPAIAVIFQLDRVRAYKEKARIALPRLIVTAAIALFVTGALSYIGAAYLSASLADTQYFLEFNIFRGIKLTFVLPLILVGIAFLQRFDIFDGRMDDTEGVVEQLRRILDMPVKVTPLLLMLAHPACMRAAMAALRKWPTMVFFALALGATIGQGSMVETFAHMRTPVYMSFMRGIGGLVLGAGIGAVAMILVELWQAIMARAGKKESKAD